jgi:hypothetical protein
MSELANMLDLLGEEVTLRLIEQHGGTRFYVPKEKLAEHALRDLLGDAGFEALWEYFGGCEIKMPLAKHWRMDVYAKRGLKTKAIAQKVALDERSVARFLNKADTKQLSLPF